MATLSVTVPDAAVPVVMAALRAAHPDLTGDVLGGTTLGNAAAARAVIAFWIRNTVREHRLREVRVEKRGAENAAARAADLDTEGIG